MAEPILVASPTPFMVCLRVAIGSPWASTTVAPTAIAAPARMMRIIKNVLPLWSLLRLWLWQIIPADAVEIPVIGGPSLGGARRGLASGRCPAPGEPQHEGAD